MMGLFCVDVRGGRGGCLILCCLGCGGVICLFLFSFCLRVHVARGIREYNGTEKVEEDVAFSNVGVYVQYTVWLRRPMAANFHARYGMVWCEMR